MELYDQIQSDIKTAMLAKDVVKRDCLRALMSDIKNQTINAGKPVTSEACIKAVQKAVKSHQDSISQFDAAGRTDLSSKEKAELEVLKTYLPKQMTQEEMEAAIQKALQDAGIEKVKKNMGQAMKTLAPFRGSMDMSAASKYLASVLA